MSRLNQTSLYMYGLTEMNDYITGAYTSYSKRQNSENHLLSASAHHFWSLTSTCLGTPRLQIARDGTATPFGIWQAHAKSSHLNPSFNLKSKFRQFSKSMADTWRITRNWVWVPQQLFSFVIHGNVTWNLQLKSTAADTVQMANYYVGSKNMQTMMAVSSTRIA